MCAWLLLHFLQVDFAPPLDYVEPQWQPQQAQQQPVPMAADGPAGAAAGQPDAAAAAAEPEEPKFLAFAGSGRRLDGKAASESRPVAVPLPGSSSGRPGTSSSAASSATPTAAVDGASGSAPKRPGKVFGGNRLQAKLADKGGAPGGAAAAAKPPASLAEKAAADKKKEESEAEAQFKAFQGKGYSLKS
jgi:ubiquitin fusion degradation protein 1